MGFYRGSVSEKHFEWKGALLARESGWGGDTCADTKVNNQFFIHCQGERGVNERICVFKITPVCIVENNEMLSAHCFGATHQQQKKGQRNGSKKRRCVPSP